MICFQAYKKVFFHKMLRSTQIMKKDKITKKYEELFSSRMMDKTISNKLLKMENDPQIDKLRGLFCDKLLHKMTAGYFDRADMGRVKGNNLFKIYESNVKRLPESHYKHWMAYLYYKGEEEKFYKCFDNLAKDLKQSGTVLTEKTIVETMIIPLKDAFPGFWNRAHRKLKSICIDKGTKELCKVMDMYYTAETFEAALDPLLAFVGKNPTIIVAKEYLAHTYEGMKRWKQEIAHLEELSEFMFYSNCIEQYYFDLAWAYDKLGELDREEEYYRKAIAERKDMAFANNNLGWCLFQQGRYAEAKTIFRNCWSKEQDLPYSANNYLRVLIKEERNREAKAFIKNTEFKIYKGLITKVESLENKDGKQKTLRNRKNTNGGLETARRKRYAKKMQFSSEKALEDELAATIEAGDPIFDKHLEIYRKEGKYGRQYITSVGIIDLLCEDPIGNLYVIELKKDSGYQDAYEQVKRYMKCLSNYKEFGNRNVYGIICLNSPSKALIEKVRDDDKVRLYEYKITLSEKK